MAVRNEAHTLPRLLETLQARNPGRCAVPVRRRTVVDDTGWLVDAFCATVGSRARVIHNTCEARRQGSQRKQAALDLAFEQARGDVLLFTDGDCTVPPTWAEEMLGHFTDPRVGVVLGRIELPESPRFLTDFQAFEQPLLNQYNFGSVWGIGMPTGCFGNNMAIRAQAVKQIGGFHALGYSVTEDAMLLDAVCRKQGWKVRACASEKPPAARGRTTTGAPTSISTPAGTREACSRRTRSRAFPDIFVVLIYLVGSLLVLPLGLVDWRVPVLSLNSFLSIGLLVAMGGRMRGKNGSAERWSGRNARDIDAALTRR